MHGCSTKDPNDWPLEGRRPDAGTVFWYGRAELKQSDHRPVFGLFDVEVLKLEANKREEIFEEALKNVGPPDGSVLLQVSLIYNVMLELQAPTRP